MNKIIALFLTTMLILLSAAGCQPAPASGSSSAPQKTEKELFDERMETLKTEYSDLIDSARLGHNPASSGAPRYWESPEGFDKLSTVGIEGLPVLIEKMLEKEGSDDERDPNDSHRRTGRSLGEGLNYAICGMLRINYWTYHQPHNENSPNAHAFSFNLYNLLDCAENDLSECEGSAEDRMAVYRKYGLLSVPYVVKEIEKGNEEFEEFFILIGAHVTTTEYWKASVEYTIYDEDYRGHRVPVETIRPTDEEIGAKLREVAGDFDYKDWLKENEEDLDFLYQYLENHCTEYEAKNKK